MTSGVAEFVGVNTPPLGDAGDALSVSSNVDGLVPVTPMRKLRRESLHEPRRRLDATPGRKIGFILAGAKARYA
jgi:hypothetical protein